MEKGVNPQLNPTQMPSRMADSKPSQADRENLRCGPCGSFESRISTASPGPEYDTSTQSPDPLNVLLIHERPISSRLFSSSSMSEIQPHENLFTLCNHPTPTACPPSMSHFTPLGEHCPSTGDVIH